MKGEARDREGNNTGSREKTKTEGDEGVRPLVFLL